MESESSVCIKTVATSVAREVQPVDDVDALGLDDSFVDAIIRIIRELMPLIERCLSDGETVPEGGSRIARTATVWQRWRLMRITRRELDVDAPRTIVRQVADSLLRHGRVEENLREIVGAEQ